MPSLGKWSGPQGLGPCAQPWLKAMITGLVLVASFLWSWADPSRSLIPVFSLVPWTSLELHGLGGSLPAASFWALSACEQSGMW